MQRARQLSPSTQVRPQVFPAPHAQSESKVQGLGSESQPSGQKGGMCRSPASARRIGQGAAQGTAGNSARRSPDGTWKVRILPSRVPTANRSPVTAQESGLPATLREVTVVRRMQ